MNSPGPYDCVGNPDARKKIELHVQRATDAAKARQQALATVSALTSCAKCGRVCVARKRCANCGASVAGLPPLALAARPPRRRRHRRGGV